MKYRIGVIGFGFLGRALVHGFSHHADIKIYDKYNNIYNSLNDVVNCSEYIFIGVPTPMGEDGSQDLSNVLDAVANVVEIAKSRKIIILRSTIIPGTTREFAYKYKSHDFIFFPEFLTARNSKLEFVNPSRIILGGQKPSADEVAKVFRNRFSYVPIYKTTWEAAEVAKYMANCFYAVKVSFMNEMYDIAESVGVPYNDLKNMLLAGGWVNPMHTDVPGHDGNRGYGGACFPKDVQAFIRWAENNNLKLNMCNAADEVNERVRKDKDWLEIKGAVSNNDYR